MEKHHRGWSLHVRFAATLALAATTVGVLHALATCAVAQEPTQEPLQAAVPEVPSSPELEQLFERQIRPVLLTQCLSCHGPDKQESDLRVDSKQALLTGGARGSALVPGNSAMSLIVQALRRSEDLQMPPAQALPARVADAFAAWVDAGAVWPAAAPVLQPNTAKDHWAFQPLVRPAVPNIQAAGQSATWPQTPVDAFILERLLEHGLAPNEPAEKRQLYRRAAFDLWGLPASYAEVEAFVQDDSPDAWPKAVDRLLAGPAYGEVWGRHWLDVARYADHKGYVFFEEPTYPFAHGYRDYVIRAFNEDLPYNRFVLEQLAADQLPKTADKRPLAGMGFLTVGDHFNSDVHDILDDRIDVVSRGLLGLTLSCCRCHDHKFDPIAQADYYSLYGILRSSSEPIVQPLFMPEPSTLEYAAFQLELAKRQSQLESFVAEKERSIVADGRTRVVEYLQAAQALLDRPPTDDFMLLSDPGDLNPTMIKRYRAYLDEKRKTPDAVWRLWNALSVLPPQDFPAHAAEAIQAAKDLPPTEVNPHVLARLTAALPQTMDDVCKAYGELLLAMQTKWNEGLAACESSHQPQPTEFQDPHEEALRQVFYGANAPPDLQFDPGWGFLAVVPDRAAQAEFQRLIKEVEQWCMKGPPRAMVLQDAPRPYEPRIFMRGNPHRPGETVPRTLPAVFGMSTDPLASGSGRLEYAQAIASERNPLTARVIANRVWGWNFGRALARTTSDFGLRGDAPTHPELLDFLATYLVDHGWSVKELQRLILLSAVYQQSSRIRPEMAAIDPDNVWCWRVNRRRLDYEGLRDSLLAASGLLVREMGGPPVPLHEQQTLPRRTVYGFVNRLDPPSVLRTFDYPALSASASGRDSTTVPLQALFLMNHELLDLAAGRLVMQLDQQQLSDTQARVRWLFERMYGRAATPMELAQADAFFANPPADGWKIYCHALLMTNEFVFVD